MSLNRPFSSSLKTVALFVILVSLWGGSSKLHYENHRATSIPKDYLHDMLSVENDTCGIEIMYKYNCTEPKCEDQAGLFNYLYLQDCVATGWQKVALPIGWFVMLAFIIYILATTADKYFCVTLTDMVEKMGIPPSIAGVTFLSFGNGGPDVFALMSAVVNGYSHIGMGSNLGAGLFITTVITGVVAFISECKVNPLSFYRDIITYILSTLYMIIVFFDNKIHLWEVIGFFVLYICYVLFVIVFRKQSSDVYEDIEVLSRSGSKEKLLTQDDVDDIVGTTGLSVTAKVKVHSEPMHSVRHMVKEMVLDEFDDSDDDSSRTILPERYDSSRNITADQPCVETLPVIPESKPNQETVNIADMKEGEVATVKTRPMTVLRCALKKEWESFKEMNWMWKIVYILELPLTILRNVTIPVVMEERFNKFNLLLTAFGMPLFLFFKTSHSFTDKALGMPYWLLLSIIILSLFCFFYFTTSFYHTPTGFMFFLLLFTSFFMSIMWVELIADQLVVLMNALGTMAGIQPFVMGLTILAVGNSISDLVGDVTITKQGYPQMAIGGIYACTLLIVFSSLAPMFSLLVGLGVALAIRLAMAGGEPITLGEDTPVINLTFVFLLITLFSTLIVVPNQKFTYTKKFGVYLVILYLVSMVLNVLAACGILPIPYIKG